MKGAEEITLFHELAPEFCLERGLQGILQIHCRYLADEPFRAGAKISETRDEPLCLKGEENFILPLKEKHKEEANTGRR